MEELTIQLTSVEGLIAIQDFLATNSDWAEIHEREERSGPVALSFFKKKLRKKIKNSLLILVGFLANKGVDYVIQMNSTPSIEIKQETINTTQYYYLNGVKVDSLDTLKKKMEHLK